MRKQVVTLLLLTMFLVAGSAEGADMCLNEPVLITSLGQNPDGLMVKVILTKLQVQYNYLPVAKAEDVNGCESLIVAIGVSNKGLGASGLTYEDEYKRAATLIKAAEEHHCPVVLVFLGGEARRGDKSDQLVALVAPSSVCMVITKDSDYDQYFTKLAEEHKTELKVAAKINCVEDFCEELFKGKESS